MKLIAAFAALFAVVDAVELTGDNYDGLVAGKTVFLKFYAPWYVVAESQRSFLHDMVYTHSDLWRRIFLFHSESQYFLRCLQ